MKTKLLLFILLILLVPTIFANSFDSGSMKLLAVTTGAFNRGSVANIDLEIQEGTGRVFIDSFPLSKLDTQISTRFAKEVACNTIGKDCSKYDFFYTMRSNSNLVGGPSAGSAITVLTISVLDGVEIDNTTAITGTINAGGIIGPVGGVVEKIEAGSYSGLKRFVIPKYLSINRTNLTRLEKEFNITIYEVSHISEALEIFTGKKYVKTSDIDVTSSYVDTMKKISDDICLKAINISNELYDENANNTATRLLDKGIEALEYEQYYSAASFCFGSSVALRKESLSQLSKSQLAQVIIHSRERADEFENYTENRKLKTLTDLETYMAVTDRIIESKERLTDAAKSINNTNLTINHLSYAIERLNTAYSWSVFFGTEGKEFVLDKKSLQESCIKKISEVEERIQYIELYLTEGTSDFSDQIRKAYKDYNEGNPELCLYKAATTKARIDVILNSMSIDPSYVDEVIDDRLNITRNLIAKQIEQGIFPIIAYSYYEYANTLKETDKYSSLLYLEYALELGNLDIYFEKKEVDLLEFDSDYMLVFISGSMIGAIIGMIIVREKRIKKKNKGRKNR